MTNVLLIKGESKYNAMRNYIDEIEMGFRLAGYNTIVIDVMEKSGNLQISEVFANLQVDLVFTCNAIAFKELLGKQREDQNNFTYITYLCDHPSHHQERLEELDERAIVFTCDAFHAQYIKEYVPNIKHVKYVPLSGSYSKKYIPYCERENDVVFTGGYINPQDVYEEVIPYYSKEEKQIFDYVKDYMIENPSKTFEESLRYILNSIEATLNQEEFKYLMSKICSVDTYVRFYYRDKVIQTLLNNGICVHVFGDGWQNLRSSHLENLIIEKGNYYIAQKAVANAKISLNIMPWFKGGFQERIASAMLSGAVAVTDQSVYINKEFTDKEELVIYSLEHLEQLPVKLRHLLQDEENAARIAENGKNRAENELTWQHRTFEMIAFIRQSMGNFCPIDLSHPGNVLQIPYQTLNDRNIAFDAINAIDHLLSMIRQVVIYDHIELCDIKFFYTNFLFLFMRIKSNFPEIMICDFVYEFLMDLEEKNLSTATELLIMQCTSIQALFLNQEYRILSVEKELYKERAAKKDMQPDNFSQQIVVQKILKKYGDSCDEDIIEILENIKRNQRVAPYNQNFVFKYSGLAEKTMNDVYYDEAADMYYAYWHGKKMYYPKGHSKQYVAGQVNFVNLEQDEESPHRYLTDGFDVCEGDIVIDAGVAEGNFALDIVERAKKIYLVEYDQEWVKALKKTFEPWKEKVVIIEKMLGDTNDERSITIDYFVKEEEVNFIKMDVEGAEINSLKGAKRILQNSKHLKCAICSYHRKNAEKEIKDILQKYGIFTLTTKGYLFFKEDLDSWIDGELRRGIVRGIKNDK